MDVEVDGKSRQQSQKKTCELWRLDQSPREKNCCTRNVARQNGELICEKIWEDKMLKNLKVHNEYFHSGGATTFDLHRGWSQKPSVPLSCSRKSLGTWSCHLTARHGVQLVADVNVALHVALERGVVESAGFFFYQ